MPEDVPGRDQCGCGRGSPVMNKTAVDNIVLGAPLEEDSSTAQTGAGCAWSGENWSCAYDAVFMSFWSIYRGSSPDWRSEWRQRSPRWSNLLGTAFDSLLASTQGAWTGSQAALSREFNSFRDSFRDELSRIDPACFRRHGAVPASVCRILGRIFGDSAEREPHLDQLVACDPCGISISNRCSLPLFGLTRLLDGYFNEDILGRCLPLQTAMTRYIQRFSQEPHRNRCPTCSGPLVVKSLSIPDMPWLWIEFCHPDLPIVPSHRLVFGLRDQHQVYTLQAIIYHGGNHFTARLLDQSTTWWKYDDRWSFGAQRVDNIENEVDLLKNDGRDAAFLLYRREDPRDGSSDIFT
jgi:hypothetical protein